MDVKFSSKLLIGVYVVGMQVCLRGWDAWGKTKVFFFYNFINVFSPSDIERKILKVQNFELKKV